jgi:hypothetical protein
MSDDLRAQAVNAWLGVTSALQPLIQTMPATTGDGKGNVDLGDGWMYVRLSDDSPAIAVLRGSFMPVDGVRVNIILKPGMTRWMVGDMNDPRVEEQNINYGVGPHGWMHQYLAMDQVLIDWRQILNLKVWRDSTLAAFTVGVKPGIIPRPGTDIEVVAQTIDLTAHIPTDGTLCVLVSIDAVGALSLTDGANVPGGVFDLTLADIPNTPAGHFRLAAVRLYAGQDRIREDNAVNDLTDLRWPQESGALNAGDVIGPASATDGHIAAFDTATGKLLRDGGVLGTAAHAATGDFDAAGAAAARMAKVPTATEDHIATFDAAGQVKDGGAPTCSGMDSDFINNLEVGTVSDELFTLAHGVNEFDLLYENGYYHLFYTTYEVGDYRTHHRAATTRTGLATAADAEILPANLVCPTAQLIGSTWHVWVATEGTRNTHHYTASDPDGPYTLADDVSGEVGDPHVRKWDIDGNYYLAYIDDGANWSTGIKYSASPSGPWTDLGYIFSVLGKETWYLYETDPAIFFVGTRAFVSFGGVDSGNVQKCGLVEISTTTWKVLAVGTVVVAPTETWMQRNGAYRVYNPVWLEHDGLLYFVQNPYSGGYAPSVATGWGYKEPAHPLLSVQDTVTVDLTLVGNLLTADAIIPHVGQHIEVVMAPGVTPPDPVLMPGGTDWIYMWVND